MEIALTPRRHFTIHHSPLTIHPQNTIARKIMQAMCKDCHYNILLIELMCTGVSFVLILVQGLLFIIRIVAVTIHLV